MVVIKKSCLSPGKMTRFDTMTFAFNGKSENSPHVDDNVNNDGKQFPCTQSVSVSIGTYGKCVE